MPEHAATRVQLCGPLMARLAGVDVTASLRGTQGRVLFAYLVTHRTRQVSRAELADAVWGVAPPPESAIGLRALISKLRRALQSTGEDMLPPGDLLQLRLPHGAWVDVEAAIQALHDAQSAVAQGQDVRAWISSHIALNVSTRTFLEGDECDWIIERRHAFREMRVRALEALAACSLRLGGPELDTALRASRELVVMAPLRESGHAHLMRTLAAQGNVAEALLDYDELRVRLREELGAHPAPELQALHTELLTLQGSDT